MKKTALYIAGISALLLPSSCIQEFEPQSGSVSADQAAAAPGSYENFVSGLTSSISGQFTFTYQQPNDFGYTGFYLIRDVMGQDMVAVNNNWFATWYQCGVALAPIYLNCQQPWTFYYSNIYNCNNVLKLAGENPDETKIVGAGIAHFMRGLYYFELAQMFAQETYASNKDALTVPIITENLLLSEATNNPRVTNEEIFKFILEDLDAAETMLADYARPDITTPDVSVVYGEKARVYLVMQDWANAEKYAKLAQEGYSVMTNEQYTDRNNGFNSKTFYANSWMFSCGFKSSDPAITYNDGDSSWGTWMICEFPSGSEGLGYLNSYGGANLIDRHLYETIPATDARKKCYIDFALDELDPEADKDQIIEALKAYSDVPENVYGTGLCQNQFGGIPLKFRSANGNHINNQEGYCVDLPMMRVEEMVLIEAEAAGMQNEGNGIQILTEFAKTRDPEYVYGKHNEAYNNTSTSAFQNEVWWQRRVEFWGEGLATLDIKRLNKGIIRSYPGTNHVEGYRWNTDKPADWMTFCIVQTESNYNGAIINNPTPIAPKEDSPEYDW